MIVHVFAYLARRDGKYDTQTLTKVNPEGIILDRVLIQVIVRAQGEPVLEVDLSAQHFSKRRRGLRGRPEQSARGEVVWLGSGHG